MRIFNPLNVAVSLYLRYTLNDEIYLNCVFRQPQYLNSGWRHCKIVPFVGITNIAPFLIKIHDEKSRALRAD